MISGPYDSNQNHLEGVCMYVEGGSHSSHAHPCLWGVTQADAMPGICKLGLLTPWGVRSGPSSPVPTLTLSPTLWDLSWKKGIFERGAISCGLGPALPLLREPSKLQSPASPGVWYWLVSLI